MKTQWMIKTRGDPLGALRRFVRTLWQQARLDGMLVPLDGSTMRLLDKPAQLDQINPFNPLMTINAARLVLPLIRDQPDRHFGAMLRPCEMRALIEMVKHDSFGLNGLLTIAVDCLATLPVNDYQWRAERKGSAAGLSQEALQFARQGGIVPYRYRSACQMCVSSQATAGDLNIGVLGLPVRQFILVSTGHEATAERYRLAVLTDGEADPALIAQRERLLEKLAERRRRTRQRVIRNLADSLPQDVDEVVKLLEICGVCRACLDVCPICAVDRPQRGADGKFRSSDVARWLISCSGCGMCEQACPHHLPLTAIFSRVGEQLADLMDYSPGRSVEEPLPAVA